MRTKRSSARYLAASVYLADTCAFAHTEQRERLGFRDAPYWHSLLQCRHIGVHRPNDRICNWTARLLTSDKRYVQKCLGLALDTGRGTPIPYSRAIELAFAWFDDPATSAIASEAKSFGRTDRICVSPIGDIYTVGHALRDYTEWTCVARSQGGHYNNLVLINHHLISNFAQVPVEEFRSDHLVQLARQVLETPPRFGFMARQTRASVTELTPDELRRRKRTFNSLVSILSMAFRHAWENGRIESERPRRCLRRVSVNHSPRNIFLTRAECRRLLEHSTPALQKLILAALYTGCRVGELGALRVEDVAFQVYGLRIAAFKRSPARYVFLPDEGMAFFLERCEGKSPHEHVLLSDKGKAWRKQHSSLFRRAVARAGLPASFVFHGLRHTYASELIRLGVSMDIVAKQLGHANTRTVANTYGHLAEHHREDQIRRCFASISVEQFQAANRRKSELQELRSSFRQTEARDYGRLDCETSSPAKSYAMPQASVLAVFERAERPHSAPVA